MKEKLPPSKRLRCLNNFSEAFAKIVLPQHKWQLLARNTSLFLFQKHLECQDFRVHHGKLKERPQELVHMDQFSHQSGDFLDGDSEL
jgi:hypothetical protein